MRSPNWSFALLVVFAAAAGGCGAKSSGGRGAAGGGTQDFAVAGGPRDGATDDGGAGIADLAGALDPNADLAGADLTLALASPDLLHCTDADMDGFSTCQGDCDDSNPKIHPGAMEVCDGFDNNCDGNIDEGFDQDMDGWTSCGGDCNDNDASIHPGAKPVCDGKDHNCNGIVDNNEDFDMDGYNVCVDCNDMDPNVNPGAMEIIGDKIDNNCNGQVDEAEVPCDANLNFGSQNADDYAKAMDICPNQFYLSGQFVQPADPRAHSVAPDYGIYVPKAGKNFAALSSGVASDENDPGYTDPQSGTAFKNTVANPIPMGQNCGGQDPNTVYDYTELKLTLKVPTNAKSLSFDFNFFSAEYPEWVCSSFNDKFLAILDSQAFKGNISFDAKNQPVTINNAFFTVTKAQDLAGTGYEKFDFAVGGPAGAATGWLTTTSPVKPGETITIRFIVFDEGDHILDSAVILDHFRWSLTPSNGPSTTRTM